MDINVRYRSQPLSTDGTVLPIGVFVPLINTLIFSNNLILLIAYLVRSVKTKVHLFFLQFINQRMHI